VVVTAGLVTAVLVTVGLLGGCSGSAAAAPSTVPALAPAASSTTVTTPVALTSASVTLTLSPDPSFVAAGGQVTASADADGSARATVTGAGASAVPVGILSPAAGTTASVEADASVALLSPDGAWAGGLVVTGVGAGLAAQPDGTIRLTAADGAQLWLATQAVQSLDWGNREGGRSLAVTPTAWARTGSLAAEAGVWAALSVDPQAATATMRSQLDCHLLGARDKATWNLEPWRPEVDTATMIATSCNPS
jgi:hypothetical protein